MRRHWQFGFGLVLLIALLIGTGVAEAQQTIAVDIDRAVLDWEWAQGTGGAATEFRVLCGPTTGVYTLPPVVVAAPATEVPVRQVAATPGTYFCVVVAANLFGVSGASNEVAFQAGSPPSPPGGLTIRAQ